MPTVRFVPNLLLQDPHRMRTELDVDFLLPVVAEKIVLTSVWHLIEEAEN